MLDPRYTLPLESTRVRGPGVASAIIVCRKGDRPDAIITEAMASWSTKTL